MYGKLLIATLIVGLTALGIAHAEFGMAPGGHLTIQSYGSGLSPFSNQHVSAVSYHERGFSSGYFRDTSTGISYGGFTSPTLSTGYSNYRQANGNTLGTVTWQGAGTRGTLSQYTTRSTNGYVGTRYAGTASFGRTTNGYAYRQPTVWGNSYGRPVTYGYDMLGSSGY